MKALDTYRRKRALRHAKRALTLLQETLQSSHLPRAERRRIMSAVAHGKIGPEIFEDAS